MAEKTKVPVKTEIVTAEKPNQPKEEKAKTAEKPVAKKTPVAKRRVLKPIKKTPAKTKKTPAAKKRKTVKARKSAPKSAKKPAAVSKKTQPKETKQGTAFIKTTDKMETVMTQGKAQFDQFTKEASKAQKEQVEAFLQSSKVFFKGAEELMKTYTELAQSAAEKNNQAMKTILGCKTLNDLTEAQNKLAQQNFDEFMANSAKLSEQYIKICTDCFEPINDQVSKAMKKANETMAA